jgi:hypothetical protein
MMTKDWRELLYDRWDKDWMPRLVAHIAENPEVFEEVFQAFVNLNGRIAHRSGFILGSVFKQQPELLLPRIGILLSKMKEPPSERYRWHVIWYLSHSKFPTEYDGLATTYAFEELGKSYAKPAVKNAAMRLLTFICRRNPELIPEYKLYLEEVIENERPTLVNQAKKVLQSLKKYEV